MLDIVFYCVISDSSHVLTYETKFNLIHRIDKDVEHHKIITIFYVFYTTFLWERVTTFLTLSKEIAKIVRMEPWATTNSTNGTALPIKQ